MRAPGRGRREACRGSPGPLEPGLVSSRPSPTAAAGETEADGGRSAGQSGGSRQLPARGPRSPRPQEAIQWLGLGEDWKPCVERPWPWVRPVAVTDALGATPKSGDCAFRRRVCLSVGQVRGRPPARTPPGWPRSAACTPPGPQVVLPPPRTSLLGDGDSRARQPGPWPLPGPSGGEGEGQAGGGGS